MRIAAYCRVSTDKEDQLNSLEVQKEFFAEYTKRTGDTLVRLYADEGLSGTKIKIRREFMRMMEDAEKGLFQMVVVKDISRFARNTVDLLQNIRRLKSLGITVNFLTANMTNMGDSEFVLTLFGAMAQEESANTSKRVKFGKKLNAQKGRVPNLVYGYDKTAGDYFNLKINREEAKNVTEIFDLYVNGGYGASKIANMLNNEGVRTKRNCLWSQNAVCRILSNEIYIGRVINGKQEVCDFLTSERKDRDREEWFVADKPELKIIEPELFYAAQRIMKERNMQYNINKTRHSNLHLFSTLIKCGECGCSFRRVERTYKNTYVRWVCSSRNGKGTDRCQNAVSIEEGELIKVLERHFEDIIANKKAVSEYVLKEFERVYKKRDGNIAFEKELRTRLDAIQKTREKYMNMYTDDLISREELNVKIGGMRREAEKLRNELKMVTADISKSDQLKSILSNTFKEIGDIGSVGEMTNSQLRKIVNKIEVNKEGGVDIYLSLIGGQGLDSTVLINDLRTQGRYRTLDARESSALPQGKAGT